MFNTEPSSFKIHLPELHVDVSILFLHDTEDTYDETLQKLYADLDSLGYIDDNQQQVIDEVNSRLNECQENPGFTFSLNDITVFIVIRLKMFKDETISSFLGILTHELNHAVTMVFDNLNLMQEDDEHRSIVLGNMMEICLDELNDSLALSALGK